MPRGRPRQPRSMKLIKGTDRPDRNRGGGGPVGGNPPEPPEWLTGEALAEWERLVPILAERMALTDLDRAALAGLCTAAGAVADAERVIAREGPTFTSPKGHVCQRPEVAIRKAMLTEQRQYLALFGMSPVDRQRVEWVSDEPEDTLAKLLREGQEMERKRQ